MISLRISSAGDIGSSAGLMKNNPGRPIDAIKFNAEIVSPLKRMLGQCSPNIEIRALGIVKEIDPEDKRVYIHWAVSGLQRQMPSKGCFSSIHGPFLVEDEWTRLVFQL